MAPELTGQADFAGGRSARERAPRRAACLRNTPNHFVPILTDWDGL